MATQDADLQYENFIISNSASLESSESSSDPDGAASATATQQLTLDGFSSGGSDEFTFAFYAKQLFQNEGDTIMEYKVDGSPVMTVLAGATTSVIINSNVYSLD